MKTIDMKRVREALPERAFVQLRKTDSNIYIYIEVAKPSMYEKGTKEEDSEIEMIFDWLRDIVGQENISEFYRISTGSPWQLWLKRNAYEFINLNDDDINGYVNMKIIKAGQLIEY